LILKNKTMKATYFIECMHNVYLDNYQEGETENVNNFDTEGIYKAENVTEAIEKHLYSLGYEFNKDYINTDEEQDNKIFYSVLCNEENEQARDSEINLWRKDKKILYANNMIIYVYELIAAKI